MTRLSYQVRAWWIQKSGYAAEDYEDAYRIADSVDGGPLRVAVADGATGATFSGQWATLLCEDYVAGRLTAATLRQRVPLLATGWRQRVETQPLPWYAEAKLEREGSHAAILGLTLETDSGRYTALSVGDCALLHLRPTGLDIDGYRLVKALPYARSGDFGSSPVLIGTRVESGQNLSAYSVVEEGNAQAGDLLLLMTDALAAWFLREVEKERSPWRWLNPLEQPDGDRELSKMVRDLRDSHRLKDDDVTVVQIRCAGVA